MLINFYMYLFFHSSISKGSSGSSIFILSSARLRQGVEFLIEVLNQRLGVVTDGSICLYAHTDGAIVGDDGHTQPDGAQGRYEEEELVNHMILNL